MLSVIIPSYKDPCLHDTIDSIIENFEGDFEIIPVIDGYRLEKGIRVDERIRPIILTKNVGMREAINTGVSSARGEYIMRTDEHCMFGKGFDRIILSTIQDDWIVTTIRYFLDPVNWLRMDAKPITYEKLIIKPDPHKFSSCRWTKRDEERKDVLLDETMAMQGSCWVMKKSWWDKVIVQLDSNGYGPHYQDTVEMIFKTWRACGKLMLNKNTWYAHKHRDFNRSHQYAKERAIPEWEFALSVWENDYKEIRKIWKI